MPLLLLLLFLLHLVFNLRLLPLLTFVCALVRFRCADESLVPFTVELRGRGQKLSCLPGVSG